MPNPTDRLIIGTAGHIDHGKSTLVRRLTGIDPDRLKEEKERGITIVLGFAPLDLPSGRRCGVVDVPGHERLVKTMIAGATGVDILLLVVAADEGVMPQTREHLAIGELLGVERGVIALTKSDLVDEEWLELVESDLESELTGSFLEGAPVVKCSAETGFGIDELLATLDKVAEGSKRRDPDGLLRIPVDRVFSIKGFGTVITGTLVSGRVQVGDTINLLPSGQEGKVRGLQVHGDSVAQSIAGTRTAVNIQGSDVAETQRGQWVVHPGAFDVSHRLDARVKLLPIYPRSLKKRTKILVHVGTKQVEGVMSLLESDTLEPGNEAFVHLQLGNPVIALPGDRLILRGTERLSGHGHTIGGAVVLRPQARRPRKKQNTVAELEALTSAETDAERLELTVKHHGGTGLDIKEILARTGIGPQQARSTLKKLTKEGSVVLFGNSGYIHREQLDRLEESAVQLINAYHEANPMEAAMPREELRSKLPGVNQPLFGELIQKLRRREDITVDKESLKRSSFTPEEASTDVEGLKKALQEKLDAGGLTPPRDKELAEEVGLDLKKVVSALKLLVADGPVVKVAEGLHFSRQAIDALEKDVLAHFETEKHLDAQQFKKLTGASRKFTIPLGEYFDKEKLTMRVGDARVLRRKPKSNE